MSRARTLAARRATYAGWWIPWLVALSGVLLGCRRDAQAAASTTVRPPAAQAAAPAAQIMLVEAKSAPAGKPAPAPVFGLLHDHVRHSLAEAAVARVQLVRSGRSTGFKITLVDGTVGFFKPEQTYAAHWYAELAAYYIDRALGLGRVPPAIGRRFAWSLLREAASGAPHADEIVIADDGTVRGAFMWWVPTKLVPLDPPPGWEGWLAVDRPPAVSPFTRPSEYRRALAKADKATRGTAAVAAPSVPEPELADRPAELADLILFDFLIGNYDRWGGRYTNVRTLGRGGPLVYIDNANGFHAARQPSKQDRAKLAAVQRMRRRTIDAIGELDVEALRATLADDPLAPVLSRRHFEDLEARRRVILEHARRMRDEHGQEATPW